MRALRVGAMVVAVSVLALPAQAAVVGLLGGDFDPAPISDPSIFSFGQCQNDIGNSVDIEGFENFKCIFYDFPTLDEVPGLDPIASIEFFLFGLNTEGLTVYNNDGDPRFLQSLSSGETQVAGAFKLSGGLIVPTFCEEFDEECTPITGLALFVGPDSPYEELPDDISGQVVAVNGTVTAAEPASLMLLGSGAVAAVAARRRARRKSRI